VPGIFAPNERRERRPNAPFAEFVRFSRTSIADEMRDKHQLQALEE
jgi:hypothetical protein